jgi:Glycine rich protein
MFRVGACVALSMFAVGLGIGSPPALAAAGCSSSGSSPVTVTCGVGQDTWTVPAGVGQATFDIQGAAGGAAAANPNPGGPGGHLQATLSVVPGTSYEILVGAAGGAGIATQSACSPGAGGAPGGADGGAICGGQNFGNFAGGGGGGASIVSQGDANVPGNWLLVAGGGGGGGVLADGNGGAGGGTIGGDGSGGCTPTPQGANQTGSTGSGQQPGGSTPGNPSGSQPGGGGGGGYWGGGSANTCGGGGGSGFIAPSALGGSGFLSAANTGDGTVTITLASPPSASIATPADGIIYAPNQVVSSSFSCAEGSGGSGLASCLDDLGRGSGAPIDTSSVGSHRFTVTARSRDGLQQSVSVTYDVVAPPSVSIAAPGAGAVFQRGDSVLENFSCGESAGGPGILRCADAGGHPSGARLDTASAGTHTLTVTAVSGDGLTATKTVTYTVVGRQRTQKSLAGFKFTLAGPSCVAPGSVLDVTLTKAGASRAYRLLRYSFFIDRGKGHRVRVTIHGKRRTITVFAPNLVTKSGGAHALSLVGLKAGRHNLSVVVLLQATSRTQPHSKSTTLKLPLTPC